MIKRSLAAALVGLLLGAVPVAAQVPDHVREDRWAVGSWIVPTQTDGIYRWYLIEGRRWVERLEDDEVTLVSAVKGVCRESKRGGMSCRGQGYGLWAPEDSFEMLPDASSATIDFTYKKKRYSAELTAEPMPGLYQSFEACFSFSSDGEEESGEGQGGGLYRPAAGSGIWAGKEIHGEPFFSFMMSGVMVTECEGFWRDGNRVGLRMPPPATTTTRPLF